MPPPGACSPLLAAGLATLLAACSTGERSIASPLDGGNPGDAASAPSVIAAPADTWTWVEFPQTRCATSGTAGLGVNLHPGATRLYIYFEGGGSCTDCFSETSVVSHYDGVDFVAEDKLVGRGASRPMLTLDRSAAHNPFADANLVFIPYCTGDDHGGTTSPSKDGRTQYFWGALNVRQFLERLVPTFAGVHEVYVSGSSAGGGGAELNYSRVRAAFGVETHLIVDSAPPLADKGKARASSQKDYALWGIAPPEGCDTCVERAAIDAYNRSLSSTARYAYLSHAYDDVIQRGLGDTLEEFNTAWNEFSTQMAGTARARTFTVANALADPQHVVMSITEPQPVLDAAGDWLAAMVTGGPAWENAVTPYP